MARRTTRKVTKKINKKTAATSKRDSYFDKIEGEIRSNQSRLSTVLGILIIIVVGFLLFNYFHKGGENNLGPASQTQQQADVSPEGLPGKYTVKDGDTLFLIAEKYYKDGNKFTEIAKANNLSDVNAIEKGQVLDIPKLATEMAQASMSPSPEPTASAEPSATPESTIEPQSSSAVQATSAPEVTTPPQTGPQEGLGTGTGGGNTTIWGPRIDGNTYTVVEGDWLSTIAGRAYGDITAYKKIAEANHIANPDLIFPGQVLTIPR